MLRPRLTGDAKQLIQAASGQTVADYFLNLSPHERSRKWLRAGNRYRLSCSQRYKQDSDDGVVDHNQMIHYISASSPAHAIDGWSLLGRGIDAALRRDTYSAVHFAYYAELRAAMALLASEGIGILDNRHPVIKSNKSTECLPRMQFWDAKRKKFDSRPASTHAVVGPCLRHWATLKRAMTLFDKVVRPGNIQLSEWLSACNAGFRARAVAHNWLNAWGLDLSDIEEDREARNLASYRPSQFRLPRPLDVGEIVGFVQTLWRMFEPGPAGRFAAIERHLLRRALRSSSAAPTDAMLSQLGLMPFEIKEWMEFLSGPEDLTPLRYAEETSAIDSSDCHIRVLSRAALLLYVATSAAGNLLRSAGYSREALAFWWEKCGDTHGLWHADALMQDARDAWADIDAALEDTAEHGAKGLFDLWDQEKSHALHTLGAWELVAIWGLTA